MYCERNEKRKAVIVARNDLDEKSTKSMFSEDFGSESLNESEIYDGSSTAESDAIPIVKVTRNFKEGEYYEALRDFNLQHNKVKKGNILKVSYVDESGDACFDRKNWNEWEDWIYSENYENIKLVPLKILNFTKILNGIFLRFIISNFRTNYDILAIFLVKYRNHVNYVR